MRSLPSIQVCKHDHVAVFTQRSEETNREYTRISGIPICSTQGSE